MEQAAPSSKGLCPDTWAASPGGPAPPPFPPSPLSSVHSLGFPLSLLSLCHIRQLHRWSCAAQGLQPRPSGVGAVSQLHRPPFPHLPHLWGCPTWVLGHLQLLSPFCICQDGSFWWHLECTCLWALPLEDARAQMCSVSGNLRGGELCVNTGVNGCFHLEPVRCAQRAVAYTHIQTIME